ncbi:MAG: photosystem II stability/assembly factor-like uncharacterized protein [Planctomycetota bacterium]|jgi:photosystem II stability/assembly factor-like uncharacterized protein
MIRILSGAVRAAACLTLVLSASAQEGGDSARFGALAPRSIGPAGMSGRITALHGLADNPETFYAGTATGGLYRTRDGGLTFDSLFDEQPVSSIGAVAVHPSNPDLIWVGTGEGNPRNSSSVGDGVYRSFDGGKTWKHVGLGNTEKIHRLLLDPDDQDVAYVAALGTTWGENEERGVFRTQDGGKTWESVLYVDERTGCGDMVMDPSNPKKIVAAMWEHRRWPWFFRSGGPGSGLYVTLDGGNTWTERTSEDGMPAGDLGRMGLAIAPSNPDVIYALVEAEDYSMLRSDDGGKSFNVVEKQTSAGGRPFYFAEIYVDPADEDRIYSLATVLSISEDGGASFQTLAGWVVHPDHHAFWINPNDPTHVIDGNDGGIAISRNRGETWRFVRNLPLAQYYHTAVDMDVPFHVYGGMQDNGSWRGPNTVWENGGIRNHHWDEVGFGDGFATIPLPGTSMRGYAMSQGGELMRWNNETGERKSIKPGAPEGTELRFSWNAGLSLNPFDANGVFYGSQLVHYSSDLGNTWKVISPDLTSDNPEWQKQFESGGLTPDVTAAENYCTIIAIAASTVAEGRLWVGTDDGRVWTTADGGANWSSLEGQLSEVPRNTWVSHVESGKHDANTAYVVLDDHRRANRETYLFRTMDGGASFQRISTEGVYGHAHVVEEDPVDPELLYLGTEHGLWITRDAGANWFQLDEFPTVPVRALIVHPRDHDLVIGTYGRATWILDDVRPLRSVVSVEGEDAPKLRISNVPAAYQYRVKQTGSSRFPAHGEFRGESRSRGSLISFFVEDFEERPEEATITVETTEGEALLRWDTKVETGLNRLVWRFDQHGVRGRDDHGPTLELRGGPEVLPGTYRIKIALGEHEASADVQVLEDPRGAPSREDRLAKAALMGEIAGLRGSFEAAMARVARVRGDLAAISTLAERAKDPEADEDADHPHKELVDAIEAATKQLDEVAARFEHPADAKGIQPDDTVGSKIGTPSWHAGSSWDVPTEANRKAVAVAEQALSEALTELNAVLQEEVGAVRSAFASSGLGLLTEDGALGID